MQSRSLKKAVSQMRVSKREVIVLKCRKERWASVSTLSEEEREMFFPVVYQNTYSIVPILDEQGNVCFTFTIGLWVHQHHPEILVTKMSLRSHLRRLLVTLLWTT
jgi:hypothetical protein